MLNFDLSSEKRAELLEQLIEKLEDYYNNTKKLRVTPELDLKKIKEEVRKRNFNNAKPDFESINHVLEGLRSFSVHVSHPGYYGLFNPRASFPGILADIITAFMNPQLAAWSHSPFANEIENYLISEMAERFGYSQSSSDGVFATGGAEANLTAVLCALYNYFPGFAGNGLLGLKGRPLIYCSSETHHSIIRAARTVGLGANSVRNISVNENLEIITESVEIQIEKDIKAGNLPFMVVGTAGTTGAGSIDDLKELNRISRKHNLWFHVDAAYGGAVILNADTKEWISGINKADSIIIDVHKWLSVPMAASMFLTSNKDILHRTFSIAAEYMPKDAGELEIVDPYSHSIQWSRRFTGLKLYLSLLFFGWEGFSGLIEQQVRTGNTLRDKLQDNGWKVRNKTPLPIICFNDPEYEHDENFINNICDKVIRSGKAWISVYPVNGINTLRACVTNYATTEEDLNSLIATINNFRNDYKSSMKR